MLFGIRREDIHILCSKRFARRERERESEESSSSWMRRNNGLKETYFLVSHLEPSVISDIFTLDSHEM